MSKVFLKQNQTAGSIRDDRINPLEIYDKDVVKIMNNSRPSEYSASEWEMRCKLAMAYRIADYYNWKQLIFNHITVKIPGSESETDGPHFLINPLGMRFDEMTASCLLKVQIIYKPAALVSVGIQSGGGLFHVAV